MLLRNDQIHMVARSVRTLYLYNVDQIQKNGQVCITLIMDIVLKLTDFIYLENAYIYI